MVVLTFGSVDEILEKCLSHTFLLNMLFEVVLSFESVDEISQCDYSVESYDEQ